jgi:RNA polymerase sigma factor (sigma-70 family)
LLVIFAEYHYLYRTNPIKMTDAFIIQGLKTNNPVVWRYVYRNLKSPFISTLKKHPLSATLSAEDWDDIYQEACVKLMENVKQGKFEEREGSSLFSYFVEIGKWMMMNAIRKKATHHPKPETEDGIPHLVPTWSKATSRTQDDEDADHQGSEEERQNAQNEFIDRVFDMVPGECQKIF